jgi:Holliday junction resolvasome RuvABC endonuclease subunit
VSHPIPTEVETVRVTLLALDLGTTTGFCVGSGTSFASGTATFKPERFEGGGMRFVRFRRWLNEVAATYDPIEQIAFEEVRRHAGTDAAHVYGGLMATLTAWCEEHSIPYQGIPVGTIKKHWTGRGNADKALMISVAFGHGFKPADDNEADALALYDYVRSVE